jgi:pimeloyl-ACP methyl ester carboxylesterase
MSNVRGELFSYAEPLAIADQGCFFVGGTYDPVTGTMAGQMFVQYQVPASRPSPPSLVLIHGGGQTGAGFLSTPDGRRGWSDFFLSRGFAVYVVDVPGRGRSQGHDPSPGSVRRAEEVASRVGRTNTSSWPQAQLQTQWPVGTSPGDPGFDQFYASQVSGIADGARTEELVREAGAELLDRIGPAVLIAHSLGAPLGWQVADARPDLVDALVAVEPTGPAFYDIVHGEDGGRQGRLARPWGLTQAPLTYEPPVRSPGDLTPVQHAAPVAEQSPYWLQAEPARRLINLARVRMAVISAEASYHAPYDPGTSAYLAQAGVPHDFIRLADHGIKGNGHMVMLEANNLAVAAVVLDWIGERPDRD